jgi:hypothetical protein
MKRFWEINKEACFWKQVSFKKIFFKYKTSNGKLLFSLFLFNFRDMDRNLLFLIFKTVIEEIVCSSQIVESKYLKFKSVFSEYHFSKLIVFFWYT